MEPFPHHDFSLYSDAEVYLKTDIPAKPLIQQEILVKRGDGTLFQLMACVGVVCRFCLTLVYLCHRVAPSFSHGTSKALGRKTTHHRMID